jgi:hypothetical protein
MHNPHTIRALLGAIVRGLKADEALLTLQRLPRDQRCRRE